MFHDAEIVEIGVDGAELIVTIGLKLASGELEKLVIRNCIVVRATDFSLQNVVLKVDFIGRDSGFDEARVRDLIDWATSSEGEGSYLSALQKETFINMIRSGEAGMASVEPSIGLKVCILYRKTGTATIQ